MKRPIEIELVGCLAPVVGDLGAGQRLWDVEVEEPVQRHALEQERVETHAPQLADCAIGLPQQSLRDSSIRSGRHDVASHPMPPCGEPIDLGRCVTEHEVHRALVARVRKGTLTEVSRQPGIGASLPRGQS